VNLFDRRFPVSEVLREQHLLFVRARVNLDDSTDCLSKDAKNTFYPVFAMDNRDSSLFLPQRVGKNAQFDPLICLNQETTTFGVDEPTAKESLVEIEVFLEWLLRLEDRG
jgi:hypothetical protein